jgi:small subunit ribosomal protein S16
MLMMRLQRVGRKNDPSYRIVVTDKRTGPKSNKHVDQVGSYNPKTKQFVIKKDEVTHWLSQGVQMSDTVQNLLISKKVIEGKKVNALPKKSPIIDEAAVKAAEEARLAAEAAAAEPAPEVASETPAEEVTA